MPEECYIDDFGAESSKQEFRYLLEQAAQVFTTGDCARGAATAT